MSDPSERGSRDSRQRLTRRVEKETGRRIRSQRRGDRGVWFGLGMFGIIGWSVAIPTLMGIALGVWIDTRWPGRFSWTLMLLFAGIVLGCMNAWYWLSKEQAEIEQEEQDHENDLD
jgi:ATP synthase protein I